jgi:succinate dehydrogenase / fumarate reductase flavoprotein subunit
VIRERYGNLFEMYEKITGEDPMKVPMRIYPAAHFSMGGLWVDYHLMSNIEGLYVLGEANFSDHGANRLGANSLLQGLVDGYFIIPHTIAHFLATTKRRPVGTDHPSFDAAEKESAARIERLFAAKGARTVDSLHQELGRIMWSSCGMARKGAGLESALGSIADLRERFWRDVRVVGANEEYNVALEKALRVADYMEFAEVLCRDALARVESCGAHFREESQTPDGEALRDDASYCHVAAWEYKGVGEAPAMHVEPLKFENVELATRTYK